jgi:hypothetical protein
VQGDEWIFLDSFAPESVNPNISVEKKIPGLICSSKLLLQGVAFDEWGWRSKMTDLLKGTETTVLLLWLL